MSDKQYPKYIVVNTDKQHIFKALRPKLIPKWSREWVIPDNDINRNNVSVRMDVECFPPSNRPSADISVLRSWDNNSVEPTVKLGKLKLKDQRVIEESTGYIPTYKFTLENNIWDNYDKLEYHFECQINNRKIKTDKPLKVKRWHVAALDKHQDKENIFIDWIGPMGKDFYDRFFGKENDLAQRWFADCNITGFKTFGESMRNTYSFSYIGHGDVTCLNCGNDFDMFHGNEGRGHWYSNDPDDKRTDAEKKANIPKPNFEHGDFSDADMGKWTTCATPGCKGLPRSTFCIGEKRTDGKGWFMDGSDISDKSIVPSTPKYLMFSTCCGGAYEPSLYKAFIDRGTMFCIGFKKATLFMWSSVYMKQFFDQWVNGHNCDPMKIPEVFMSLLKDWKIKLQPAIFGNQSAQEAISVAVDNALNQGIKEAYSFNSQMRRSR